MRSARALPPTLRWVLWALPGAIVGVAASVVFVGVLVSGDVLPVLRRMPLAFPSALPGVVLTWVWAAASIGVWAFVCRQSARLDQTWSFVLPGFLSVFLSLFLVLNVLLYGTLGSDFSAVSLRVPTLIGLCILAPRALDRKLRPGALGKSPSNKALQLTG